MLGLFVLYPAQPGLPISPGVTEPYSAEPTEFTEYSLF